MLDGKRNIAMSEQIKEGKNYKIDFNDYLKCK